MTTIRERLARILNTSLAIPVREIEASRAVFIDSDTQRIDIRITTTAGDRITLELTPKLAHTLITQAMTSYYAIVPPPPGQGMARGWGMQ